MEKDQRIPDQQGFMVVSPNDRNPKGFLYFTEDAAIRAAAVFEENASKYPKGFDTTYWSEKPEPYQIFELKISRRIK